jgi:hypothetical protein
MEKPENDSISAILMDLIGEVGSRAIIPLDTVQELMSRIVELENKG